MDVELFLRAGFRLLIIISVFVTTIVLFWLAFRKDKNTKNNSPIFGRKRYFLAIGLIIIGLIVLVGNPLASLGLWAVAIFILIAGLFVKKN